MAFLYVHGENTYRIEQVGKKVTAFVCQTQFKLSSDAMRLKIHDDWEMEVCQK